MGGKSTTSTQSVQIPPEVLARYNAVNKRAEEVADRPFIAYSDDPNAFVQALTPSQQAGIENINAVAGMSQPSFISGQRLMMEGMGQATPMTYGALGTGAGYAGAAGQAIGAGQNPIYAQQFSQEALQPYMSPYMSSVVAAQQALQQQEAAQQRSALTGDAIKAGAYGGDRSGIAQANLARQQSLANQATLANLLQSGYTQGLGAFQQQQGVNLTAAQANRAAQQNAAQQLAALGQQQYAQQLGAGQNLYQMGLGGGQAFAGLGSQAEQQGLSAAQAQMAAGQIQQQTDQAAKTALYNQFLQQQGYPYQQAQFLGNLAMGTGALSGSTTTTTQPSGWSDRRLKENIKKVGKTYDGQDIYSYNLKGENRTQLGLMAQDVEKDNPEAVGMSRGYKTLDYKKATEGAAKRGHFYQGGLVPSSMGGPVYEPGMYAEGGLVPRTGFAEGGISTDVYEAMYANPPGSVGYDPNTYGQMPNVGAGGGSGGGGNGGGATTTALPSNVNDAITQLYKEELGRTPDKAGADWWANEVNSGRLTLDQARQGISSSSEGYKYDVSTGAVQDVAETPEEKQAALIYREELGRAPASKAETDQYEQMLKSGKSPAEIRAIIAASREGTAYDTKMGVTPGVNVGGIKAATTTTQQQQQQQQQQIPPQLRYGAVGNNIPMPTGIPGVYQDALTYNPMAFRQSPGIVRNQYGFYAAPQYSSASSFDFQSPYMNMMYGGVGGMQYGGFGGYGQPQMGMYGQAPMGMYGQPQATGKGPSSYGQAPMGMYGQQQQPSYGYGFNYGQQPSYGQMPTATGKGAGGYSQPSYAQPSYSAPQSGGMPTASGKGSTSSGGGFRSGGRVAKNVGGLLELARSQAGMYQNMAGGPGTERIKHTLQQPSREAIRDFRSSGAAPKPQTFGDTLGQAAKTGENIGKLYDMGEKVKNYAQKKLAADKPDAPQGGGATTTTVKPSGGASLDGASNIKLAGGKIDPEDWGTNYGGDYEMPTAAGKGTSSFDFAAKGGRINRFAGGRTGYRAGGLPSGLDPEGIDIPDEMPGYKLNDIGAKGGGSGGGSGGFGQALGTAASIASLATTAAKVLPFLMSVSDERAKDNKEPIGELFDGQKVYRYDFGDGRTEIGLMAQEVEKHHPKAVREIDGLKMVDYDKAVSKIRSHKYSGGPLEDVEYREVPKEETRSVEPVRVAARNDVMSDAPLPGLGAVREAPMPTTGLIPIRRTANMDINPETPQGVGVEVAELNVGAPNFGRALDRVFREEGGLNRRDTNGEPSLYGINRRYHPEFFDNPTRENAAKIYRSQYWDAIGADDMSPELAHVAFDTAVIAGAGKARELVKASGGDPMKLLELRKQFQDGLIERDPAKYGAYARTWDRRVNNLRADIVAGVDGEAPAPGVTQRSDVREGVVPQARTPGVAGPGQGPMDKKSAPYLNLLERAAGDSLPDELKTSAFWRPLIAGFGTMLASNKPRFSQALGEGLVGAVAASGGEEERAQSLAASRATTEKTMSDIVGSSFKTENGITFIKIIKPDGSYDWLPYNEWLAADPDKRPKVDPRVEAIVNQARGAATRPAPAGAGATGDSQEAPRGLPPGVRPAKPGVDVPRNPAGVPMVVGLSKEQAGAAARAAFEMAGSDAATKERAQAVDYFDPQLKLATGARSQQQVINPLAASFASIPASQSISTSGKAQEVLQPFMATLNNIAAIAGKPDLVQNPSILMNQEEVNKLVNQLQQGRLNDTQLRAVSAFKELADGIPSLSTSPGGQYALMSKLLTANMREIDKDNFFNDWQAAGRGDRGQYRDFVRLTSREANREFDRNYTDAFYAAERAAIEKMFRDKAPDPSTGKETPIIAYLTKYGSTLGEQEKKMIKDRYGPNILRYFGVPN